MKKTSIMCLDSLRQDLDFAAGEQAITESVETAEDHSRGDFASRHLLGAKQAMDSASAFFGVDFGWSTWSPNDPLPVEDLLKSADDMLYEQKRANSAGRR